MGMYTEIVVKMSFDAETLPTEVREVLDYLFGESEKPATLPEHNFFYGDRWEYLGKSSSFYHHPASVRSYFEKYGTLYLFARSDIKNYDGEIEHFFNWIAPHTCQAEKECLGWTWYEEDDQPNLTIKDPE